MGKPRSALAAMQQAAGRRPESVEIQRLLAAAYAGVQDTGHRIEALQRAIALDPARADESYDDLGGIYRSTGRYDEAETCYRKCLEQRPEHAPYHYVLAKTHLMRSDRDGYLQQAIAQL